jgi:pimeloyl-ACP methyl ester carboxylesterase
MVSKTVDLDGPVHYLDFAGAGTPLVCVHGLGGAALNWMAVGPRLAEGHRVLAPDLPGFGRTPLGRRRASLSANRKLIDRFIREVAGSPAIVVGNSMGGLLTVLQAAHSPETVRAAVLVDPALPWQGRRRVDVPVAALFGALMVPGLARWGLRRRMRQLGPDRVAAATLTLCTADPYRVPAEVRQAHLELARERAELTDGNRALIKAARSLGWMLGRRNFAATYAAVEAPVLIVHGDQDRLVPVEFSLAIGQRYDWHVEVLRGVGHVPQMEVPELFVDVTLRWLHSLMEAAV